MSSLSSSSLVGGKDDNNVYKGRSLTDIFFWSPLPRAAGCLVDVTWNMTSSGCVSWRPHHCTPCRLSFRPPSRRSSNLSNKLFRFVVVLPSWSDMSPLAQLYLLFFGLVERERRERLLFFIFWMSSLAFAWRLFRSVGSLNLNFRFLPKTLFYIIIVYRRNFWTSSSAKFSWLLLAYTW